MVSLTRCFIVFLFLDICSHLQQSTIVRPEIRFRYTLRFFLTVFAIGILERAVYFSCRMTETVKVAFISGSSKQGKARRASVGSNSVAAKYLKTTKTSIKETLVTEFLTLDKVLSGFPIIGCS